MLAPRVCRLRYSVLVWVGFGCVFLLFFFYACAQAADGQATRDGCFSRRWN